ncbi:MAG: GTPase [Candidatus Thermoplasmatota archaeon]
MFPIPTVLTARELLDKAFRRAAKATGKGTTKLERGRRAAVAKVQTIGDTIDTTLRKYGKAVPTLERLPDFARELVDLLVGIGALKHDLGAIDWCRDQVMRVCRQSARQAGRAATPADALRIRKATYGRVGSLVQQIAANLESLAKARKKLIQVPDIDPEMPTIVVAGYPNVGKSQFVRAISSGKPAVAPYPFTTQGLNVGHFDRRYQRYLVVDTPGLLDRPMEKRNPIERQAILALRHLADVIVFLFDPTETCGCPVEVQERLLAEVREAFAGVPVIEVENKADLMRAESRRLKVSALTGEGCQEVADAALAAITSRVPAAAPPPPAG